jgi:hypothetical protein
MVAEEKAIETQQSAEVEEESVPVKPISAVGRVWGTLFEPSRTFAWLDQKPLWLLPVIILIIIVVITSAVTRPYQIEEQIRLIEQNERLSPEQKEQYSELTRDRANQPFWKVFGYAVPVVGVFIYVLLLSAIWYFGGNIIMGGETSYKKVLSIYSHTTLTAIPATIVKLPLMLAKGSVRVHTSLAALLPSGSDESVLFKILAKFDIFNIWQHILLAIGLTIIYKFSLKKSATLIIAFYAFWIVVSVLFSVLTKGRFMMG